MKSASDDVRREPYNPQSIKAALDKLKGRPKDGSLDNFSLPNFLKENHIVQPEFEANLGKWPKPIQTYISKQLIEFADEEQDFSPEDLEIIDRFFETALQKQEPCEDGQFPISEERWHKAMRALAHKLRQYYGLEENDTEFPCWRRGLT